MRTTILLMPLQNEGTDVWGPVAVEALRDGTYRILGPMPDDERWRFAPGSIVGSRSRAFESGVEQLVAAPIA